MLRSVSLDVKALAGVTAIVAVAIYAFWFSDIGRDITATSDDYAVLDDRGPIQAPEDTYNPVLAGEETPDGYVQVLRRDMIQPVYNPEFVTADAIDWEDETLVIGVALGGEAKAYPVTFLGYREMVNDSIGGSPVLVSW